MTSPDSPVRSGNDLIEAYLADLERALGRAEPAERDEVTAAVTEHIEQALAERTPPVSRRDIEDVLADLGSPDQVAASVPVDDDRRPSAERTSAWPSWAPGATVVLGVLSLALILVNPVVAGLAALLAVAFGVAGARCHGGSPGTLYRIGAALGILTSVLLVLSGLGLLKAGSDPAPGPSPPQSVPVSGAPS